jgi:hypothetical protein
MILKYLIDENVIPAYSKQLRKQAPGLTVLVVGEPGAPLNGTLDPDILIWCEQRDFILVTNNRRSMPVHLTDHIQQGRHIPGIILLNPNLSIGQNLEELKFIALGSFEREYQDRIVHLPLL